MNTRLLTYAQENVQSRTLKYKNTSKNKRFSIYTRKTDYLNTRYNRD